MSEVLYQRNEEHKRKGDSSYYDSEYFQQLVKSNDQSGTDELWTSLNSQSKFKINSKHFVENHPDYSIQGFHIEDQQVLVTEYAPLLFRNIRKIHITETNLFKSFIPSRNFQAIFNFKTGDGKSPSFFFFTDNNLLMLKTLKESEFNILMNKSEFMMDYFKYVTENPDCLLSKLLGLYKIEIG